MKTKLTKELLLELYSKQKKSTRQIAKETGWGRSTILNRLREYKIYVRGNTELRKGMVFSKEWRDNISKNHADVSGENNPMYGVRRFGEKSPVWQGGKTELLAGIRNLSKYSDWRSQVFVRDEFMCQECGDGSGGNLQADHIVPLSFLVEKLGLKSVEDAHSRLELWNIDNGKTLCVECHKKTDTYGAKAKLFEIEKE